MRLSENARLVAHSQLVMSNIDALVATTFENESAQRAYVLTGEEPFAAEYTRAMGRVDGLVQQLRDAVSTEPAQLARVDALAEAVRARMQTELRAHRSAPLRRPGGRAAAARRRAPSRPGCITAGAHPDARAGNESRGDRAAQRSASSPRNATPASRRRSSSAAAVLALIFVSLALFAIRRDFAGRARAESELNRFFDLSIDLFVIASADGCFKRMSPAVKDMLGYTVEEAPGARLHGHAASRRSRAHHRRRGSPDRTWRARRRTSNRGSATRTAPTACCPGARSRRAASCTPPRAMSPTQRAAAEALREAKEQLEAARRRAHARAGARPTNRCARASGAFARSSNTAPTASR